jgi:hypothetical protein
VSLSWLGPSGLSYLIEESSDLLTWQPVKNAVFSGDFETFAAAEDSAEPVRFFQLRFARLE